MGSGETVFMLAIHGMVGHRLVTPAVTLAAG